MCKHVYIYICLFIYSNVFKVWFWFSLEMEQEVGSIGRVRHLSPKSKQKHKFGCWLRFLPVLLCEKKHYLQCLGAETSYWYLQHCGLEFLLWFLFFHVGVGLSWLCCQFIFLRCCLHLSCSTPPKNGKSKQKQQKHRATQPRNQKPQE